MKIHLLFTLVLAISGRVGYAQRLSPEVLASAGGVNRTAALSLEWTLGEMLTETATTQTNIYTQGFHQPLLQVNVETELVGSRYSIEVAPNPVTSILTVRIDSQAEDVPLQLRLTNLQGQALFTAPARSRQEIQPIDMSSLPSGVYLLKVQTDGQRLLKSFKIVKN